MRKLNLLDHLQNSAFCLSLRWITGEKNSLLTVLLLSTLLIGCASRTAQYRVVGEVGSLAQLETVHAVVAKRAGQTRTGELQLSALRDIGSSLGAQAGLAARSQKINQSRAKTSKALDQIFNFNLLLLPHHVLPPVLVQGENTLNLADTQTLRIADRTYQIVKQARFVSTPPHWREYLWLNYSFPEKPPAAFLPKTRAERYIWQLAVREGWKNGILQADTIDADNLSRLKRDYLGILLYRKLLKKGMVSKPYVAHTNLGVTGDSNALRIHDQILRITALPALQITSSQWRPIITRDEHEPAASK